MLESEDEEREDHRETMVMLVKKKIEKKVSKNKISF